MDTYFGKSRVVEARDGLRKYKPMREHSRFGQACGSRGADIRRHCVTWIFNPLPVALAVLKKRRPRADIRIRILIVDIQDVDTRARHINNCSRTQCRLEHAWFHDENLCLAYLQVMGQLWDGIGRIDAGEAAPKANCAQIQGRVRDLDLFSRGT